MEASLRRPAGTEGAVGTRRLPRCVLVLLLVAGFTMLVALLYLTSLHAIAGDSDGATVVLEGQSMISGHLMLHGWALSLDSFWTVDALFYALVELVTGVRSLLLYFVPALIAALVIAMGALLARSGRKGVPGVVAAATVIALLALPSHALASYLLRGPVHVGTALWCLVAFAGLRSGRVGWGWVVAVVAFAAGALGDFQMVALGMIPAFIAGVVAGSRRRNWRAGFPNVSAAGAGLLLAGVLRTLARAVGTFAITTSHPRASAPEISTNLVRIVTWGANMLGVGDGTLGSGGVPAPLQAVHMLGLLAVVSGVVVSMAALVRGVVGGHPAAGDDSEQWRLDDLLVIAFVADLVVFVLLTYGDDPGFLRYLTAAVIFGAVLAGRLTGRLVAAVRSGRVLRAGAVLGAATLAMLGADVGYSIAAPSPSRPFAQLGRFLHSHDLRQGVGDYWSASITTVSSAGSVTLRPVIANLDGRLVRYQRQSAATWYAHKSFQFLVYDTARPWGGVNAASASATFGPVERTYVVGTYRVLVWSHPVSVSTAGWAG